MPTSAAFQYVYGAFDVNETNKKDGRFGGCPANGCVVPKVRSGRSLVPVAASPRTLPLARQQTYLLERNNDARRCM
jgi:hypothetical protein